MVFVKAFAVGIVTGLLAPVVVVVVQWTALATGLVGRVAVTAGGGGGGSFSSYDVYIPTSWSVSPNLLFTQIAVGFAVGFLFMLWRALVRRQVQ